MSKPITNIETEGEVTSVMSNFRMTDEEIRGEVAKYTDMVAIAVYRSENATLIVAQRRPKK